jgi:hypothetical protein
MHFLGQMLPMQGDTTTWFEMKEAANRAAIRTISGCARVRALIFRSASAIKLETTCGESPFTQSIRVALAAVRKCYDPGGNDLSNDLIRVPEAANIFDCSVVSIGHQLNVRRFKHRIADEWNYRGHESPH